LGSWAEDADEDTERGDEENDSMDTLADEE
jgi:hypothetical protein